MSAHRAPTPTAPKCRGTGARWLAGTVAATAIAACAGPDAPAAPQHTYKLYPGPVRPQTELAIVELRPKVQTVRIGHLRVSPEDYSVIELLPGEHRIALEAVFGVSAMVNPSMQDRAALEYPARLEAGRRYLLKADRTYGQGYRMFLWIEDAKTGAVIAGRRKP